MQPSIAALAFRDYLLFVLSILKLTLASHMSNEWPFGAEFTESSDTELTFPNVSPAARDNYPLWTVINHIEIAKEPRHDEHDDMIHPDMIVS